MFSAISSLNPKKYVKINPKAYAITKPKKYSKYLLSAINGIKDSPDTPIPREAVCITAWNAPPTAAPKQAVINGFPSGNVTPYNSGSPIPKKPTGNPPLITFRSRLFLFSHKSQLLRPLGQHQPLLVLVIKVLRVFD